MLKYCIINTIIIIITHLLLLIFFSLLLLLLLLGNGHVACFCGVYRACKCLFLATAEFPPLFIFRHLIHFVNIFHSLVIFKFLWNNLNSINVKQIHFYN